MSQEISPQLQQILERFGSELEAYIQSEVQRQVGAALNEQSSVSQENSLTNTTPIAGNPLEGLQNLVGNLPKKSSTILKSEVIRSPEESYQVIGQLQNTDTTKQYTPSNGMSGAFTLLNRIKLNRTKL